MFQRRSLGVLGVWGQRYLWFIPLESVFHFLCIALAHLILDTWERTCVCVVSIRGRHCEVSCSLVGMLVRLKFLPILVALSAFDPGLMLTLDRCMSIYWRGCRDDSGWQTTLAPPADPSLLQVPMLGSLGLPLASAPGYQMPSYDHQRHPHIPYTHTPPHTDIKPLKTKSLKVHLLLHCTVFLLWLDPVNWFLSWASLVYIG